MNIKKSLIGMVFFTFLALSAFASDISGTWIAPTDQEVDVELVFKVKGEKLKGSVDNPLWGKTDIKDGEITGNTISFYINRENDQMGRYRVVWKGTVVGEMIRFTCVAPGMRPRKTIA